MIPPNVISSFDVMSDMSDSDKKELQDFRERETSKKVIVSAWNPDKCPCCHAELSESLGYASNMKDYKEHPENYKGSVADVSTVLRVALTSLSMTPDLYEIMSLLGKEKIAKRYSNFS